MEVAVGGSVGSELSEPETESSEVIGLIAAMIILAFTFGTLVAMGLPLVSAVARPDRGAFAASGSSATS